MPTILPESELVRRAAVWISEQKNACSERNVFSLMDEAGMRFNLSPVDQQMLSKLFSEEMTDQITGLYKRTE